MRSLLFRLLRLVLVNFVGKRRTERLIWRMAQAVGSDLLTAAYHSMGILKYEDGHVSGEHYLVNEWLGRHLRRERPVLFDVGANTGEYSAELKRKFPEARVYAFEPNASAYEVMLRDLAPLGVSCYNLGLSSTAAARKMYTYEHEAATQHASVYREVLTGLHGETRVTELEFRTTTLDEFCAEQGIDFIDFLKIDTEGHEWEVLGGAKRMVAEGRVHLIQFEFNEMNVISRVFLRDFYEFLGGYSFYRLDTDGLIPLGGYSSTNEIFKFQNLLAVNDRLEAAR